jgi:hypothetical protein
VRAPCTFTHTIYSVENRANATRAIQDATRICPVESGVGRCLVFDRPGREKNLSRTLERNVRSRFPEWIKPYQRRQDRQDRRHLDDRQAQQTGQRRFCARTVAPNVSRPTCPPYRRTAFGRATAVYHVIAPTRGKCVEVFRLSSGR